MATRPPSDGEPPERPPPSGWEELVQQVEEALDEAGVAGDAARDALLQALGEALDQLDLDQLDLDRDEGGGEDAPPPPEVTVVDGGRRPDQPRSRHPRPPLRVAEGEEPPAIEDPAGEGPPVAGRSVRVVRVGGERGALSEEGWIRLEADARQAVYRGAACRAYRVACTRGRLAVSVDGVTVETLAEGQSLDVEGSAVVVLSADEQPAAGTYARLGEGPPR